MISPVMPTYARADLAFDKGEGVYLYATDGKHYLDFGGGIEVHPLALVEGKVGPGISGHDGRYHRNCSPALTAAVKTASRQGKRPSILIGMEGVNVSWD